MRLVNERDKLVGVAEQLISLARRVAMAGSEGLRSHGRGPAWSAQPSPSSGCSAWSWASRAGSWTFIHAMTSRKGTQ